MPTKYWYCDVCGERITDPEDGYVIWKVNGQGLEYGFKVIHNGRCDTEDYPSSLPLADLVGENGLTRLLAFLSVGVLRADPDTPSRLDVLNIDEFVDLMRRLHVPHYEEARRHFWNSGVCDAMSDANEAYPYTVGVLEKIASGKFDQ